METVTIQKLSKTYVTFRFKNEFQGKAVEPCTTM